MANNEFIFALTDPKPRAKTAKRETLAQAGPCSTGQAVVLDMGEASREEGFRQNGCR